MNRKDYVIVKWEVEDGYVGKSRPQTTYIPKSDLEGMDEREREEEIEAYIQNDFEQRISWGITSIDEND